MKYKAYLILLFLCIILPSYDKKKLTPDSPMNKPTNAFDTAFIFDQFYLIDPIHKTISVRHYWEKDEIINGTKPHSFGYNWDIDSSINFDFTSLYINDNYIAFKEHYVKPLKVRRRSQAAPVQIDGYEYVNSLYEKGGKFYELISREDIREVQIPHDIDFANLTPMVYGKYGMHGFYLYDDKALYFLRTYPSRSIKKIASAKNKVPIMHVNYCEYDGKAYQNEDPIGSMDKLVIFDVQGDGNLLYVTDGTKIFTNGYIAEPVSFAGMDKWIQVSRDHPIVIDDGNVYIPSLSKGDPLYFQLLFHTPSGFVALSKFFKDAPISLKDILILHEKRYEPLDIKKYQMHYNGFYTYKNKLYRNGILVENDFDGPQIRGIKGIKDCFSDGKQLAYQYAANLSTGRIEFKTVPIADVSNLHVVHSKLLTDGINFYQINNDAIEVIPLSRFPFDVVIELSTLAYSTADYSVLEDQIQTIYTP